MHEQGKPVIQFGQTPRETNPKRKRGRARQNASFPAIRPRLRSLKLRYFVFSPNGATISQPRATPWVGDSLGKLSPEGAALLIGTELGPPLQGFKICHGHQPRATLPMVACPGLTYGCPFGAKCQNSATSKLALRVSPQTSDVYQPHRACLGGFGPLHYALHHSKS